MSYDVEETCMSYEEEDICMSYVDDAFLLLQHSEILLCK
jgi:hypothetical protein